MQVCHGKAAPLKQINPGDKVVYYSPTTAFDRKTKLQAFTALGIVKSGDAYQFKMSKDFHPFRRDVDWFDTKETSIYALLEQLEFSSGQKDWGYQFRYGLLEISDYDMQIITTAMIL